MCLVGIKLSGVKINSEVIDLVADTAKRYRSGFGYAFKREGESVVHFNKKVNFKPNEVIDELVALNLQDEDELIWHGRAATHGDVTDSNAHPYIIGEVSDENNRLTTKGSVAINDSKFHGIFMHNGIFRHYETENPYLSDTYNFGITVLNDKEVIDLIKNDPITYSRKYSEYGWARLAFLFPDVGIRYTSDSGDWIEDEDTGLLFSNSGYGVSKLYDIGGKTYQSI
jgi:predicted glutamine amidotransferase